MSWRLREESRLYIKVWLVHLCVHASDCEWKMFMLLFCSWEEHTPPFQSETKLQLSGPRWHTSSGQYRACWESSGRVCVEDTGVRRELTALWQLRYAIWTGQRGSGGRAAQGPCRTCKGPRQAQTWTDSYSLHSQSYYTQSLWSFIISLPRSW